ncbi:hypothetical protein CLV30_12437 [Haloactinopolyspora alba]|uniref:ATP-grasp domain-containing protein n=1 Tax=Haloactinopolyspora alba TaxID=648780 RepID=A0A2P8DI99_9ACTN|nr:hypothetical protein [Haloactinopolyspora alba]PSK96953.1 hypothetical protein CLV30_12437 [Haloactinopolyspora alba]
MTRVALATCAQMPDLQDDDALLLEPLRERGIDATPVPWDDAEADWASFDLVVLRSTWDYARRRDEFLAWARHVPSLANPAELVEWNTDKTYLRELAAAGVPVVPTTWVDPGEAVALPADGEYVVKPAVGAGSLDTGRYRLDESAHRELAAAHVERLTAQGRTVMLQPYLAAVDEAGETAVLYLGGRFSHAIRKGPMLDGPDQGSGELFRPEQIDARNPSSAELDLARRTLDALPADGADLLYARVDMIPGADGAPVVLEVELTEPSLFLDHDAAAPARFADAVAARVSESARLP